MSLLGFCGETWVCFRMNMYTPRLTTPPRLLKIVTNWNRICGTSSTRAQTPYIAKAHHCTKKAATKNVMLRAALWAIRMVSDFWPIVFLILRESDRMRVQVRRYRTVLMTKMRVRGTVVKQMLATTPFTPSK